MESSTGYSEDNLLLLQNTYFGFVCIIQWTEEKAAM